MYCIALKYQSVIKRAEKDSFIEFRITRTELSLLTSLAQLILETGRSHHGREKIFRRAFKPLYSAKYYAAMHSIVEKGFVIVKVYRKDKIESLTLSMEGLTIVERFDMRIQELFEDSAAKDTTGKTIDELIRETYK